MAKFCFERAGDARNATRCQAALLNQHAKRLEGRESCAKYREAARVYMELGTEVRTRRGRRLQQATMPGCLDVRLLSCFPLTSHRCPG